MVTPKRKIVCAPRVFSPKHCQWHHRLSSPPLSHCCAIVLILCQNFTFILPILFQEDDSSTSGTRCFCDKKNCGGGALVCAGRFCLIGVRHEDSADGQGRLDQHCLEQEGALPKGKGCARDWRQWSEVCICEENLCNTWAFLRAQMDLPLSVGTNFRYYPPRKTGAAAPPQPPARLAPATEQRHFEHDNAGGGILGDGTDRLAGNDGNAKHQRMPTPYDSDANALARDYTTDPLGLDRTADVTAHRRRGPALVLLLVVLPLVVGAFTVVLVFLNYHCNML